jgi:hypothetical protein
MSPDIFITLKPFHTPKDVIGFHTDADEDEDELLRCMPKIAPPRHILLLCCRKILVGCAARNKLLFIIF